MAEITIKEIKKVIDDGFEKQALMIKRGFDETATKSELKLVENRLTGVETNMLRLNDRVKSLESNVDRVLYKEMDRLERRVTKLEQKTGISPA
ncbi:MAG: hypothetical protein HY336_02080 [Candidatus Doudnabacteria bacterium]|nr:hypothetical protein [Candidatus Doudnabacteria bacterium]